MAGLEGSLIQLILRMFDSVTYQAARSANGSVYLIHVATLARGQHKVACMSPLYEDGSHVIRIGLPVQV
ncbi:uncharacterized protein N7473_012553 [Penicillium subrubescens]|jgi:hypothetical protein|uniref:uncharacterized protein n=1 Tax=Penicillium subrubescens TaxID=1316194 RepID=UPI00254511D7|nr:uncharacterized protein N7473_012553 [Penicillium subrubescens]KAJ5875206.1 hypothetical protein N7473_012553 [Penicillium subrubescens]